MDVAEVAHEPETPIMRWTAEEFIDLLDTGVVENRRIAGDRSLKSPQREGRRDGHARLCQDLNHILVGVPGQRLLGRIAASARRPGVFDAVAARQRRRINLVRRSGNPDPMSALYRPSLQQVRQPHIGLEHVVVEPSRAFDLQIDDRLIRCGGGHRVVRTPAIEQIPGREHPRSNAAARFDRLFVLEGVVGHRADISETGHSVGQMYAAE